MYLVPVTLVTVMPIKLVPSRFKNVPLLLGATAFVATGIFILQDAHASQETRIIGGWGSVVFFGLGMLVFALNLPPNAAFLEISPTGLKVRTAFRTRQHLWKDFESFGVYDGSEKAFQNKVMVNYVPSVRDTSVRRRYLFDWSRKMCGFDGMLPDTYGMGPQALVTLLEEWRLRMTSTTKQKAREPSLPRLVAPNPKV